MEENLEQEFDNKLLVTVEGGRQSEISVIDIIESEEFDKEFILYTLENDSETVYASILNEDDNSFSLDTITDPKEIEFINMEIDRLANEEE